MIIVTGAGGQLGRAIVESLLALIPADQVGVSIRNPQKAIPLEKRGVRVRQGDFASPATLSQAFEGATQVLIVSSNARAQGGDPLIQHHAAIEAARTAGAQRIVYTSHMAASSASAFSPMLDHAATEDMLRQSGIAWTSLRNGFYAESGMALMGNALQTGILEAPADGKVCWTAHRDLAEAAAIILTKEGLFNGPTPPLTASESLNLADLADIASDVQKSSVHRLVVPDEEFLRRIRVRGMPEHVASISLGLYLASRQREFDVVDPTLERLLGRRPITMRQLIAEKSIGPNDHELPRSGTRG